MQTSCFWIFTAANSVFGVSDHMFCQHADLYTNHIFYIAVPRYRKVLAYDRYRSMRVYGCQAANVIPEDLSPEYNVTLWIVPE